MLSKLLILTTATIASTVFGQTAGNVGIAMSLESAVIEQAKDVYMDSILKMLKHVDLPDVTDKHGNYLKGNYFTVDQSANNVEFLWQPAENGVTLIADKLSAVFYSDSFRYKSLGIFIAKGHCDVKMSTVNLGMGIKFTTQTLADGRVVPAISSYDVLVDIDRNDINIQIWGNIWADFAAAFEVFFKSEVVHAIQDSMNFVLSDGVPQAVNSSFAKYEAFSALPVPEWELDWMTPAAAIVGTDAFEVGIEGLFFDKATGEVAPSVEIPVLPYESSDVASGFQAYVSTWSIDSFVGSYLEVGSIQGWFNSTDSTQFTTSNLNFALRDIESYYGPDLPVDIHFQLTSLTDFGVTEASQAVSLHGDMILQFWVHTTDGPLEMATQMTLSEIYYDGTLVVEGFSISPQISKAVVGKVAVDSCTFGNLSALTLRVQINSTLKLLMPMINARIASYPITFPSDIYGIFTLSDLSITYHDSYVGLGATPTFLPVAGNSQLIEEKLSFLQ